MVRFVRQKPVVTSTEAKTEATSRSRRRFLTALGGLGAATTLSACAQVSNFTGIYQPSNTSVNAFRRQTAPEAGTLIVDRDLPHQGGMSPFYSDIYGAVHGERVLVPPVPYRDINPIWYRQEVINTTRERTDSIVIDRKSKFLYLVLPRNRAWRYGIGVGPDGMNWQGRGRVVARREWPHWVATTEMIANDPDLGAYAAAHGGMRPSLENPHGARVLYVAQGNPERVFKDKLDFLFRIHGTQDHRLIGRKISHGSILMLNQDIIHLFKRAAYGTPVLVY